MNAAITIENLILEYLLWMEVHNYAERTIEARKRYLGVFAEWCFARDLLDPCKITEEILEHFKRSLYTSRKKDGQPLSFRTQRNRLVPIRSFFRWLYKQKIIALNPAAELDMPRMEKRLPKAVLSIRETEIVLSQPDIDTETGIRDRAILEVFYSTALRRSELAGLCLSSLDKERGLLVIVQGKGKKDRVVPIGERALKWTEKYIEDVRPKLMKDAQEKLFLNDQGKAWNPKYLSAMVTKYVRSSETEKEGSCHLFRHSCATHMLENGADIRYIQQLLGHANLSTTQVYAQVSIRKLKEVHSQTHPAKLAKA